MTGLKTNERPGTRAVVKYVRVSPSKARAVLDLVRGESYGRASEILAFSERSVSEVIGKCLDSAVANAENNDNIPAEELFVSACYADEGPTLKNAALSMLLGSSAAMCCLSSFSLAASTAMVICFYELELVYTRLF